MSEILEFTSEEMRPGRAAVLDNQGVPEGRSVSASVAALLDEALETLDEVATPVRVTGEISADAFEAVYRGQGLNEGRTPVGDIYPRAEHLSLAVITLGAETCREIGRLFAAGEPARGAMLDAAASAAADQLGRAVERRLLANLKKRGRASENTRVLLYSPGYCGWHISAQRRLFDALRPERIGVKLRDSFLMEPLKTISGVLIAGPAEIHVRAAEYDICGTCETRSCRERIRAVSNG